MGTSKAPAKSKGEDPAGFRHEDASRFYAVLTGGDPSKLAALANCTETQLYAMYQNVPYLEMRQGTSIAAELWPLMETFLKHLGLFG